MSDTASHLMTREQQIVAMANELRNCRWFQYPDGVGEDKELVWATRMWEAANPTAGTQLLVKDLDWSESGSTLTAGMLGQHYLINPSGMIDHFKLNTPDGTDYFPTAEAAKGAAQADLERRISAVLVARQLDGNVPGLAYPAIHAHTVRKAASREEENGYPHLAEELSEAMQFIERVAAPL
jgi:hypothetical protein